jgi:hypothetical protein
MTIADSDLPAIDLDARAVCSTAGKLMIVPIITFPRPDGRTPQLGSCPRFEARKVNGLLTGGS